MDVGMDGWIDIYIYICTHTRARTYIHTYVHTYDTFVYYVFTFNPKCESCNGKSQIPSSQANGRKFENRVAARPTEEGFRP